MNIIPLINFWKSQYFNRKKEIVIPQEPRMYLILREDLAFKYIQGAHALAKYGLEHPDLFKQWNNGYLICLSVFNGLHLNNLKMKLQENNFIFSEFVEPDLVSELPTAICFFDDGYNGYRKHVSHLNLATK